MQNHPENTEELGSYYKGKFDALSDIPEDSLKESLFEKMDLFEGKRSKTVYLHFNLFGMKIAASLTMLIISSLALVAVAAVTILAVKNNAVKKKIEILSPTEELKLPTTPTIGPAKSTKSTKQAKPDNEIDPSTPIASPTLPTEAIPLEIPIERNETEKPSTIQEDQKEVIPTTPIQKKGDNSKLLQEVDEEEDLFKK